MNPPRPPARRRWLTTNRQPLVAKFLSANDQAPRGKCQRLLRDRLLLSVTSLGIFYSIAYLSHSSIDMPTECGMACGRMPRFGHTVALPLGPHLHTHTRACIHTHTHACPRADTHTRTHAHTHTHTHTHIENRQTTKEQRKAVRETPGTAEQSETSFGLAKRAQCKCDGAYGG